MKTFALLTTAIIANNAAAFAPSSNQLNRATILQSSKSSFDPLNLADENVVVNTLPKIAAVSAAAFATSPLAAMAGKFNF